MTLTLKHALTAIILVLIFPAPVAAGPLEDYKDALAADTRGDYATALRLLRPLAEQGHAGAQWRLGNAYETGHGVPKNEAEALKWYLLAADQGDGWARYSLGLLYLTGRPSIPQDLVTALMWLILAADDSPAPFTLWVQVRDIATQLMNPAQIAEAQKRARDWKPTRQSPR